MQLIMIPMYVWPLQERGHGEEEMEVRVILYLLVSRGSLFQVFNQLLQTTTRLLAIHLMYQLAPLFADPRPLSLIDNLCEGTVEFSI